MVNSFLLSLSLSLSLSHTHTHTLSTYLSISPSLSFSVSFCYLIHLLYTLILTPDLFITWCRNCEYKHNPLPLSNNLHLIVRIKVLLLLLKKYDIQKCLSFFFLHKLDLFARCPVQKALKRALKMYPGVSQYHIPELIKGKLMSYQVKLVLKRHNSSLRCSESIDCSV